MSRIKYLLDHHDDESMYSPDCPDDNVTAYLRTLPVMPHILALELVFGRDWCTQEEFKFEIRRVFPNLRKLYIDCNYYGTNEQLTLGGFPEHLSIAILLTCQTVRLSSLTLTLALKELMVSGHLVIERPLTLSTSTLDFVVANTIEGDLVGAVKCRPEYGLKAFCGGSGVKTMLYTENVYRICPERLKTFVK